MRANTNVPRPISVLVIAHLVAGAAAVEWARGKYFPDPAPIVAFGLLFAQLSLAAIWLCLGGGHLVLRLVAYIAAVGGILYALGMLHEDRGQWLQLLAVQSCAVSGPLAAARWCGLRLQTAICTPNEQSWQYSLKHVFLFTTASALLLGLFRLAPSGRGLHSNTFMALVVGGGFALMALAAAWVALGHGRLLNRLLALPAVTFLVGYTIIAVEGRRPGADVGLMGLVFAQMFFVAGSLAVFRRCGYRLVRHSGII